jgi:hypothetical protein
MSVVTGYIQPVTSAGAGAELSRGSFGCGRVEAGYRAAGPRLNAPTIY